MHAIGRRGRTVSYNANRILAAIQAVREQLRSDIGINKRSRPMRDWFDITRDIRALRDKIDQAPLEPPEVHSMIHAMLNLLHTMALRLEEQRVPPYQSTLDDLRISTLTQRFENNEAAQTSDFRMLERRLDKAFDAIMAKLEAVESKLPEPPRGLDG